MSTDKIPEQSKFKKEFIELAFKECKNSDASNHDLADFFRITVRTIINWKKKHPEFKDAIIKGKKEFWIF